MNNATAPLSADEFIGGTLRAILEAPSPEAAVARFPELFEPDFRLIYNGKEYGPSWLEAHVHQLFARLKNVKVDVTHAARDGDSIGERHIVSAIAAENGAEWEIEVLAMYELSKQGRIARWYELSRIIRGEYSGW